MAEKSPEGLALRERSDSEGRERRVRTLLVAHKVEMQSPQRTTKEAMPGNAALGQSSEARASPRSGPGKEKIS